MDTFRQLVGMRSSLVAVVATLAAGLLVVATFNDRLIPLTELVRVSLIILLALIVVALWDVLLEIHRGTNKVIAKLGVQEKAKRLFAEGDFLQKFQNISIYIYIPLMTIVIIFLIFSIIRNW